MPGELRCDICGKEVGETSSGYKPYWYYVGKHERDNPRVCRECWAKHCDSDWNCTSCGCSIDCLVCVEV
jgi:hypothetical protein